VSKYSVICNHIVIFRYKLRLPKQRHKQRTRFRYMRSETRSKQNKYSHKQMTVVSCLTCSVTAEDKGDRATWAFIFLISVKN